MAMEKWKTVFNCEGCEHYKSPNGGCDKFCHYALDTGECRVVNKKIVPAEKCFTKKIFFEGK